MAALKDLSSSTMTVISRDWLDPAKERPILLGLSRVAPLLADLEDAHRDLLEFQNPPVKISPEMAALNERAIVLDALHDRKARGIHDLLGSVAELTDDADDATTILAARDELFPQGKSITKRSYIDQAGEAARSEKRLSERSRRLLQHLTIRNITLEKYVNEWRTTAVQLGDVEKQRILLAKETQATPQLSVGKARNAWISAVNAILSMLDREKGLSDADRRRLLEPLETALARAAAKKRAEAPNPAPNPVPAPAPDLPPTAADCAKPAS